MSSLWKTPTVWFLLNEIQHDVALEVTSPVWTMIHAGALEEGVQLMQHSKSDGAKESEKQKNAKKPSQFKI